MTLKSRVTEHRSKARHIPHEASVRVDERVRDIGARRKTALRQTRLAARDLKRR